MKKLIPHHSFVTKGAFVLDDKPVLIPELCSGIDNIGALKKFVQHGVIKTTDANEFESESEFIITNVSFFNWLKKTDLLSYTIFCDEDYFNDVPTFYKNEWSKDINTNSMDLIGWTVNKYTEPACFYGIFPIQCTVIDNVIKECEIINISIINDFGLIDCYKNAKEISDINTSKDPYNEIWRPLAIYVDKFTLHKIQLLKKQA